MSPELEVIRTPQITDLAIRSAHVQDQNADSEHTITPLSHYLWLIRREWWKISAFVALSLLVTFIISSKLARIYESTATIDVDRQAPTELVGSASERTQGEGPDVDQYLATQVKLIQSDAVLRPVAMRFGLLRLESQLEGISADQIAKMENAPIVLHNLKVTRSPNTYLILVSYRSVNPQLSADVATAIAESYLDHSFKIRFKSSVGATEFMERQLDELKAKMERSNAALAAFERELNVISPEEKSNITSARLLQLNTEYTNAQADRVRKQANYEAIRTGSLAAVQASGQNEDLQRIQDRLRQAQEILAQVRITKGLNHPETRKTMSQLEEISQQYEQTKREIVKRIEVEFQQAINREKMLAAAVQQTKAEFDKINAHSFDYQRLKQEAEADKHLYQELTTKIHEAGINSGFQNRNVTIADSARPGRKPVFPRTGMNLLVAGLLSLFLGIAGVILVDSLDTTIRDPELIRQWYRTELIGSLPMVRDGKVMMITRDLPTDDRAASQELALQNSQIHSSFHDAVRMVRNSILLSDTDRRLRSILFTSATPGEGKTTTAMHLAIAHAEQGKKTLLIDADLRRPVIHRRFGVSEIPGLANVLDGSMNWQTVVVPIPGQPNLDLIPSGLPSRRAADLVGERIGEILDEASGDYDLIIIDAPPLLGFAESMQLAIAADGVVVVAIAGETNRKAVGAVIDTLRRVRANIVGIMLNRTSKTVGSYYYYGHYSYEKYGYYSKSVDPLKG